jgi:mannose-6-phosphate isomerase-like protein (cupin superfamily)
MKTYFESRREKSAVTDRCQREVKHYPKEALFLKPDVPGAKMWSVALAKTMLTYFETDPHSRFRTHSHASEQITMVLEGELFFRVKGRIIRLQSGDVLAVPPRIPHAAFTKHRFAKAIDAWSPVMKKYSG